MLAAVGGGAGYVQRLNNAVTSIVCLDVNPSIQLTVNRNERVLSATPANADAQVILDGMDLTGAKVDAAMNAIVGSLLTNGYVDQLANSILITVEDDDAQRGAQLQQELTVRPYCSRVKNLCSRSPQRNGLVEPLAAAEYLQAVRGKGLPLLYKVVYTINKVNIQ